MNQPPFNPLKELSDDPSGITHRANKRLREWMEHHNEAYERETCPVGGCDEPVKLPRSNEIKCWGESIDCAPSEKWMAEITVNWDNVRERMNDWARKTQNPECLNVFFGFTECVCEELAREDCPPNADSRLIKYHNLGDGWHGFSYPIKEEEHLPEINKLLLDKAWEWIIDQEDFGLDKFEFGRCTNYKTGVVSPFERDAYVKFKMVLL